MQYRQSAAAVVIVRTLVRGALTADFVELSNFKSGFKSQNLRQGLSRRRATYGVVTRAGTRSPSSGQAPAYNFAAP